MAQLNVIRTKRPKQPISSDRARRAKWYGSRKWRALRLLKLEHNPLCERCEQNGLTVPAEQVHHIVSPFQDGGGFYDWDNLQAICVSCHAKEHGFSAR